MSGCGKSLSHGSSVNSVVEDTGSEGVPTHSLTSNASALAPSNTPIPTSEPSKSALPASDSADTGLFQDLRFTLRSALSAYGTADTGSSVEKYAFNIGRFVVVLEIGLCVVSVIWFVIGICYNLLYSFADIKPRSIDKLGIYKGKNITAEGYKKCYCDISIEVNDMVHFFDYASHEYIDETPVLFERDRYYKPNLLNPKPLLRKMFGIKAPTNFCIFRPKIGK
jgi:hypothetical protein